MHGSSSACAAPSVTGAPSSGGGSFVLNASQNSALGLGIEGGDGTLTLKNGATWQVVGSDNYNSLVGSPPVGIVASEWALAKPAAWAYLRPILQENGGWAVFNTTPRGKNHAHRMLEGARSDPAWFTEVLPAKQTDVFTPAQLEQEKRELMREYGQAVGIQMFDQEYMCSFDQPVVGAIYAAELSDAKADNRIRNVPYDPAIPVQTWWDIGGAGKGGDATAIWFVQVLEIGRAHV